MHIQHFFLGSFQFVLVGSTKVEPVDLGPVSHQMTYTTEIYSAKVWKPEA